MQGMRGFTLLELMFVIAIMWVVLAFGIPSLREMLLEQHQISAVNQLVASLHYARSEAIKRGMRVTLCKSTDAQTCNPNLVWEQGWLIFVDAPPSGQIDAGDQVLLVTDSLTQHSLRTGGNYERYLSYLPNGMPRGSSGLANDTFRLCDARGAAYGRAVVINTTGRVRTSKGVSRCP